MTSKNLCYYWCFNFNRKDDNPWYNRHQFGRIISTIGVIFGILIGGMLILDGLLIGSAKFGDLVTHYNYCNMEKINFIMECTFSGVIYLFYGFLNSFFSALVIGPLLMSILYLSKNKKIINTSWIVFVLIMLPTPIYGLSLIGAVFKSIFNVNINNQICDFKSYDNFVNFNCYMFGVIGSLIIAICYLLIFVLIISIIKIKKCISHTRKQQYSILNEYNRIDQHEINDGV